MPLREEDLLGGALDRPPSLHAPLQRPQLSVLESTRVAPLQILKERLGLEPWVDLEMSTNPAPDLGERIRSRPPGVRRPDLARELSEIPVLARRLLVHAGLRRRDCKR